jgi:hypothetical protein
VWKPEGKRPVGRRRRGWQDDIKMDLKWDEKGLTWNDLVYGSEWWFEYGNELPGHT